MTTPIDDIVDQKGWSETKKHIMSHSGFHLMKFLIRDYLKQYKGYLQRIEDAIRAKSLEQIEQACKSFEKILVYYVPADSELMTCIRNLRSRSMINLDLVANFRELEAHCQSIAADLKK